MSVPPSRVNREPLKEQVCSELGFEVGPNGAATRLGVNRSTLQFRMKKLGIARPWTCECQTPTIAPSTAHPLNGEARGFL
jgi:hypothetical protein